MTEGLRSFLVGLTGIVALVGFAVLLVLFGELDALQKPRYELAINTDHAAGLRPGSTVELNGVPIGIVDQITTQNTNAVYPVRVVALIDQRVEIPITARPSSASSLLGGAAILEIEALRAERNGAMLPKDDTAVIDTPLRIQMLQQIASELDSRMAPILQRLDKFDELSETYIALGRNLNELVTPQNDSDLETGEQPNMRSVVARLYEVLDESHEAMALARDWLGDEQIRADARNAVHKASLLMDQASTTLDEYAKLAVTVETNADSLVQKLLPVADDLAVTLESFRAVSDAATKGDGTVSRLLRDPALYESLDDAAVRLDQTLRELRLLIQKVQTEGLPLKL